MTNAGRTGTRSWAGVDLAERQRIRRDELLLVGIELLGAVKGPAVNVRAVCRAAGLTERYFYESFADRDQFVLEVYENVAGAARDALIAAVATTDSETDIATAAVNAFVELIVDHPAMGRVLLLAPTTEPGIGARGLELVPGFTALIEAQLSAIDDPAEKQMTAIGLVGALVTLFANYLDGVITVGRDRFVRHCVAMLERANRNPSGQLRGA